MSCPRLADGDHGLAGRLEVPDHGRAAVLRVARLAEEAEGHLQLTGVEPGDLGLAALGLDLDRVVARALHHQGVDALRARDRRLAGAILERAPLLGETRARDLGAEQLALPTGLADLDEYVLRAHANAAGLQEARQLDLAGRALRDDAAVLEGGHEALTVRAAGRIL